MALFTDTPSAQHLQHGRGGTGGMMDRGTPGMDVGQ